MPEHFADRLCAAIKAKGTPACVGLDPVLERLPAPLRAGPPPVEALASFGAGVIETIAPWAAVIKINSAFFEAWGPEGLAAYFELVERASQAGLVIIGDVKRGDIGHSSESYARAHLSNAVGTAVRSRVAPDAITVNSYLGLEGVRPFLDVGLAEGKGVFALVQTSNESAAEIQDARLASGESVAEHVARLVNRWAGDAGLMGRCGYSALGAVVSPRDRQGTRSLRSVMDRCVFLVPGYGAQGKAAGEIAECFKSDGTGAIVNASRSVIYAFDDPRYASAGRSWQSCVEAACKDFVREINAIVSGRTFQHER